MEEEQEEAYFLVPKEHCQSTREWMEARGLWDKSRAVTRAKDPGLLGVPVIFDSNKRPQDWPPEGRLVSRHDGWGLLEALAPEKRPILSSGQVLSSQLQKVFY